ncbi:2-hydroxyacid dehydrogenase [Spartinivicinus ruber]|uniref:2-hydroxyacid dehydrogenase n=1 Tax=Spartinivicinus ruber TaxID=2683272 RepID=UPI002E3023D3|nr:2-hydroxyacid dehydrogenase [Spartinivicinus ruber]
MSMKLAVFNTHSYDKAFFEQANNGFGLDISFFEPRLTVETVKLAEKYPAVCAFVNDVVDREVIEQLAKGDTKLIALRSAGYNNVDLAAAKQYDINVANVPAYSPESVAEYTVGMMLTLNRKIHRAYNRVKESNFALNGFIGFDFHNRTVGVIGTGRIGTAVVKIMHGMGCRVLAYDPVQNEACLELGVNYVGLPELLAESDVITLHCPMTEDNYHIIDEKAVKAMKDGVMLLNTSRGGLIDTDAVIAGLKSGKISNLGLDVYENEKPLLYDDHSNELLLDDVLGRLLTFPNVLITGHQGFFTEDALSAIASTTLYNVKCFYENKTSGNEL